MKEYVYSFYKEDDAIAVIELVLILIVLVGLVVLFKDEINKIMTSVLKRVSESAKKL